MTKIIGFTISEKEINHEDIDVFNRDLNQIQFFANNLYVYLWGVGDIKSCKINNKYTLSFPLNDDLLDRNIIIDISNETITIENDWLGSIPVFYNKEEKIISTLSLKTFTNTQIHNEGLHNFFEFGYNVFEQTPFKNVKFMRYFSKLFFSKKGIRIEYKEDPALQKEIWDEVSDEKKVFEKIKNYINNVEEKTKDEIILPTSGGYDSRLLNLCVNDKTRINSFTYGLSTKQDESYEVVHAKKISEILKTKHKQIKLDNYYKYIPEWFKIFGFSTHLHGMYHIEFYEKILSEFTFSENTTFLSGIFGDVWAGLVTTQNITSYTNLNKLAYSHGLHGNISKIIQNSNFGIKKDFWEQNKTILDNSKIRICFLIRIKIILISYLATIPEYFGFPVWTPFLNFNIAKDMLNLPQERRNNREWQADIFKGNNLDLENMNLKKDFSNTLDFDIFMNFNFEPINKTILSKYIDEKYIEDINKNMSKKYHFRMYKFYNKLFKIRYVAGGLYRLGFRQKKYKNILLPAEYNIIKAIELALNYTNK